MVSCTLTEIVITSVLTMHCNVPCQRLVLALSVAGVSMALPQLPAFPNPAHTFLGDPTLSAHPNPAHTSLADPTLSAHPNAAHTALAAPTQSAHPNAAHTFASPDCARFSGAFPCAPGDDQCAADYKTSGCGK